MSLKCSNCNKLYEEREPFSGALATECPNCGTVIERGYTAPPSDIADEMNEIQYDNGNEFKGTQWEPEGSKEDK